ncbi:unnamed protein product [Callosobruchus maculatus]|uniref:Uncharacterized protein n=1 Tax=Callosobruchus maculatus TaxID=64391 RepID=A0A653BIH3_CALMS|nr:unnamed protein product [Callosobruchus maculatus]
MPMDAAERKRRSRARQREDPDKRKLLLEKEKERSMKRRMEAKRSQDEETKSLCREKDRLRKQIYRNKLKAAKTDLKVNESTSSPIGSYKTKRTLKKAVNKVMEAMPVSSTKKEAVVRQLARNILPSLSLEIKNCKDPRSDTISKENVEVVRKFYELDEISRAAPGRKDTISIKDTVTGKRDHVAKRHMTMSVAEAYQLFKKDYPDIKVGKSKFFEFRPPHVRTMNDMPHNVCVCPQHANFLAYYRYLAICQEPPEEDNEVKVMYMKNISKGNEAKQFVTTPNDVSYVAMSEIIEVLPEPTVNTIGNRIYYEFNENVDVFEAG